MQLAESRLVRERAYVNGAWIAADSGETFPVVDPASGAVIGRAPAMGAAEAERAVAAADAAWPAWRALTAGERAGFLRRWHDLVLEHEDDLAALLTAEMGKPLAEARGEIRYGASFIAWFAEEARRAYGEVIPTYAPDRRLLALRGPVGVVAAITPWNFPNAMITRKVAPALAAGCTVVLKPAEDTPLSALALAWLAERAGLPGGVFNVVTALDPAPIGAALTSSPLVRKLSFTGSTEVGKRLLAASAESVKKVSLELGGNAPFIVFDDADLDEAVAGAIAAKYRNSGQTCVCANRLFAQAGIYDAFARRLAEAVERLAVGPGVAEGVAIGPLINREALAKVERLVADARDQGAGVLTGGGRHPLGGTFYAPTVLVDVTATMACMREEIFGPVAPLVRFEDEAEAIALANDTPYGLAAYFYARDVGRIWRVAEALEYGMVGVNTGLISTAVAPFGGVKESGIGREGGRAGIEEFLEIKYVCLGGL